MADFIKRLKDLGRFDNSLIIFQSDHGSLFKVKGDRLVNIAGQGNSSIPYSTARSRSLLLIKLPGVSADAELSISNFEASLVDIAPTIDRALGLEMSSDFSGFDLFSQLDKGKQRVRYYHFHKKKGKGGWTDKMVRYRISNSTMTREGSVKLSNNEPGFKKQHWNQPTQ